MTHGQLFKAISEGRIAGAYVLYGEETLVLRSAVDALKKKLLPEGFEALNLTEFDGEVAAADVIAAAETMPLMAERRLVILNECPLLAGKAGKKGAKAADKGGDDAEAASDEGGADDKSDRDGAELAQWLSRLPDTCCLVFVSSAAPNKTRRLSKALVKAAEWVEFRQLQGDDLSRWCAREAARAGHSLPPDAFSELVFFAGQDLMGLRGEIAKLCAYAGAREVITPQDVRDIVTPRIESSVFRMIDMLFGGKPAQAMALLRKLLYMGNAPEMVVAMLTRQLRIMTGIRSLRAQGVSLDEIEQKLALNHYAAGQAARQAARYPVEALERAYAACVSADYAFKSGRARTDEALDRLMLTLCSMKT